MRGTRDKILDAANKLFYADGVRAVSVDAVAATAGVTKRTLYYHFRSKDELIAAYLESRDQPNLKIFKEWFDSAEEPAANKIAVLFQNLARSARHPKCRGCGFLRTIAELANMPGHPAVAVGAMHKKKFELWIAEELSSEGRSSEEAAQLARHIVLLLDGAFSAMLTHRDASYVEEAGRAAARLVAFEQG